MRGLSFCQCICPPARIRPSVRPSVRSFVRGFICSAYASVSAAVSVRAKNDHRRPVVAMARAPPFKPPASMLWASRGCARENDRVFRKVSQPPTAGRLQTTLKLGGKGAPSPRTRNDPYFSPATVSPWSAHGCVWRLRLPSAYASASVVRLRLPTYASACVFFASML